MSKNESKIPLVLALLGLGYLVFRAVGYVNDYRAQHVPPAPAVVAQAQTAPQQEAVQPSQISASTTVADNATGRPVPTGSTDINTTNSDEVQDTVAPDAMPQGNRKLWGIVREGKRKG